MYAVIQTGGKQYRVAPGDTIRIERVDGKVGKRSILGPCWPSIRTTRGSCWGTMPEKRP